MDKYIKEVKANVLAEIKISNEIRKEFKRQYREKMTDREMAEVILCNIISEGIFKVNHKGFNLDGIGLIKNNVYGYDVKEV